METLPEVILLGIIEGITEFLPISSTGHLLIAEYWLGRRPDLFNIAIQAGAICAVVLIYRRRLWQLCTQLGRRENRDYAARLALAFAITVVGALAARALGVELPLTLAPVAWALILGGVAILLIERGADLAASDTRVTWKVAVWVGLGQVLAMVFPGTSRSAASIFAAMLAGCTSRAAATEFSFLLGIPTMFAAVGYELLRVPDLAATPARAWLELGVGFVVSAAVAFGVVKWLLHYIQNHHFTAFAWYRIGFGALLLTLL